MGIRALLRPRSVPVQVPSGKRGKHLRLLPPPSQDVMARLLVLVLLLTGFVALVIERIRAEEEDRLDLEDARSALAEVEELGTISWEEIKREHGL